MKTLKPFRCVYCGIWHTSLDSKRRHALLHRKKCLIIMCFRKLWEKSEQYVTSTSTPILGTILLTDVRPYQYKYREDFTHSGNLNIHIRTHTKKKPYQCEYCQKCFAQKGDLQKHVRTQTKEKLYQCEYCKKHFLTKSNLMVHIKTHTKEKTRQCEYCEKQFSIKSRLMVHIKTHTKEKTYQCQYCQKYFLHKSKLTVHIRSHTKEKPYECVIKVLYTAVT